MNTYLLSIYFLFVAALCQALGGILALRSWLDRNQPKFLRRMWLAFGLATTLFAVHSGYTLALATKVGLYDLKAATLLMLGGLLSLYAIVQLRRTA